MNWLENLNRTWFLHINGSGDTPHWLITAAIGIAVVLLYLIPVLLAALWLWGGHERRRLAANACLAMLVALAINQGIGLFWYHPRPFMLGLGHLWLNHAANFSFPSNHMTAFASVGLALLIGGATRLAVIVLAAGAAVAWARVFLGVHFPLDMAGAVLVSAAACGIVLALWRRFGELLMAPAERTYRLLFARPIAAGWIRR